MTPGQDSGAPRPEDIGHIVRRLREERGLSRDALARAAGLSWAAVGQIETGRRRDPRVSTLIRLADALDVRVDDLLPERRGAAPQA